MCFQLGRFPYELPAGLPDEQLELMYGYLQLKFEIESGKTDRTDVEAAAAERRLQADESAAWKSRRGGG